MKKTFLAIVSTLPLMACEVPVMVAASNNDAELTGLTSITFPARLLITADGQPDLVYAGEMVGRMSGAADIALASADGRTCSGAMTSAGVGEMTCDDITFALDRRDGERTSMSGTVYRAVTIEGTGYASAFGWGRGASEAVLRETLIQRRSFGGAETRDIAG